MEKRLCEYKLTREGDDNILKVNCMGCIYGASIEDSEVCMARIIDKLLEMSDITKIVLSEQREYEYNYEQTKMLLDVADAIRFLVDEKKILSFESIIPGCEKEVPVSIVSNIVQNLMRKDPLGAYVEIKRNIRELKIQMGNMSQDEKNCNNMFILKMLEPIRNVLENLKIVKISMPYLEGYKLGDRSVYRKIFKPSTRPNFMFTRLQIETPARGKEIDAYRLAENTAVSIFNIPDETRILYHLIPPEFILSDEDYIILDATRDIVSTHQPYTAEFADPDVVRKTFFNIFKDLIKEVAISKSINLTYDEINKLAEILVRETVGFGIIEIFLSDPKIQDIYVNSPVGSVPIYVVHSDYGECKTNIIPSKKDAESWATKLRMISGRPLDEANPVLDTSIDIDKTRARVSVTQTPLNAYGLGFAIRRHRLKPWTYPLFINNKAMTPLAAGLLSFLIDGSRTFLFAGTRAAGKTSLLSATMVQIMKKYRQIVVEDTKEIPVDYMRDMGFDVQSLLAQSPIIKTETELPLSTAIRASLRLGDSSLIIGEVRSTEAKVLYEAMRVGALANVVAGTIHGDSPYGVFDRVVNDLGVPITSFKATDIIVIANQIKSPDGLHMRRRITQITEVRKDWRKDPLDEKGFVDLMVYDAIKDSLEPTSALIDGESEILKSIASKVREWSGNWESVWENILLRSRIFEELAKAGDKNPDLLEADFVVLANSMFHIISDKVLDETGILDSGKIFEEWNNWLKSYIKEK